MDFQDKMQENLKKNMFREKQTINKVALMFLNVELLTER